MTKSSLRAAVVTWENGQMFGRCHHKFEDVTLGNIHTFPGLKTSSSSYKFCHWAWVAFHRLRKCLKVLMDSTSFLIGYVWENIHTSKYVDFLTQNQQGMWSKPENLLGEKKNICHLSLKLDLNDWIVSIHQRERKVVLGGTAYWHPFLCVRFLMSTLLGLGSAITSLSVHVSFASTSWQKRWFPSSFKTHYINLYHTSRTSFLSSDSFWHSQRMSSQAREMITQLVSQSLRDHPWKWNRWWCCRCPVWKSPAHGRWSRPGRSCKLGRVSFWRGWSTSGAVFKYWGQQFFSQDMLQQLRLVIVGSYYNIYGIALVKVLSSRVSKLKSQIPDAVSPCFWKASGISNEPKNAVEVIKNTSAGSIYYMKKTLWDRFSMHIF